MPLKFVRPCIPTTAKAIPRGDAWLHEPKLDGYRFQIVKDGSALPLYSKSGYEWTKRLTSLAEAQANLLCISAVIDGELVFPAAQADAMHALLVLRADQIKGCIEGSLEEADFKAIAEAVEVYEAKRWPDGKAPGGKG